MMPSREATWSQKPRETGSLTCSSSQPRRRGASTTTPAAAITSALIESIRSESSPSSVAGVGAGGGASMLRCAAMRPRSSSTSRARCASSCSVPTRRSRSSTLTGAEVPDACGAAAGALWATASGARGEQHEERQQDADAAAHEGRRPRCFQGRRSDDRGNASIHWGRLQAWRWAAKPCGGKPAMLGSGDPVIDQADDQPDPG